MAEENKILTAEKAYFEAIGVERGEQRWPVPEEGCIQLDSDHGEGVLVDFSTGGFAVKLPRYLANGVLLEMNFRHRDGGKNGQEDQLAKIRFHAEIRWAKPIGSGTKEFLHGCQYKNLDKGRKDDILAALRAAISGDAHLKVISDSAKSTKSA